MTPTKYLLAALLLLGACKDKKDDPKPEPNQDLVGRWGSARAAIHYFYSSSGAPASRTTPAAFFGPGWNFFDGHTCLRNNGTIEQGAYTRKDSVITRVWNGVEHRDTLTRITADTLVFRYVTRVRTDPAGVKRATLEYYRKVK